MLAALACSAGPALAQPAPTAWPADARPGQLLEAVFLERWDPGEVQRRAAAPFGAYGPPVVENAVDLWRLRFVTTDLDGGPAVVTAQAFTPVAPPRGAAPLLVYGAGTTGLAPACAPSREHELQAPLGHYRESLAPYAGRGLAVVLPDYLGFDDPQRPQAYFVAEAEAHVLLDAARATRALYASGAPAGALRDDVFVAGYSQGGHAAFAAADRHAAYAPELRLRGAVGHAATTDVTALLATAGYYAGYVLLAYRDAYGEGIDPAQVLAPRFLADLAGEAGELCVDRTQLIYPYAVAALYTPAFHRALQAGSPEEAAPAFARALAANATGLAGHGLPALVVQGGQDVVVRDAAQEAFVAALCATGSPVTYLHVPLARHRDTRPAGFDATLAWVWSLADGQPAPATCAP
ncbi:MAG: lipase family protein [Trueperaceae bacterium]